MKPVRRFTSIADGRDSAVEVLEADHPEATGIQELGQILHLGNKHEQQTESIAVSVTTATQTHSSLISSVQMLGGDVMGRRRQR